MTHPSLPAYNAYLNTQTPFMTTHHPLYTLTVSLYHSTLHTLHVPPDLSSYADLPTFPTCSTCSPPDHPLPVLRLCSRKRTRTPHMNLDGANFLSSVSRPFPPFFSTSSISIFLFPYSSVFLVPYLLTVFYSCPPSHPFPPVIGSYVPFRYVYSSLLHRISLPLPTHSIPFLLFFDSFLSQRTLSYSTVLLVHYLLTLFWPSFRRQTEGAVYM